MKKSLVLSCALLAGLTACTQPSVTSSASSASPSQALSVAPAGPTATQSPSATAPPKSVRGNFIKVPGQSGGLTYNDKQTVRYTVKSITANYRCADGSQPQNGEIVVFDIDVETYPELVNDPSKSFSFNSGWKAIGQNGTTMNGNPLAYGCLSSSEELLQRLGPGERATGKLAFDVPSPSGILIFTPNGPETGGWEWNYPVK